jgi:predicted Zn-dependent peptidase
VALPPPVVHVRRSVLDNGVRVLTDRVPDCPSVTIGVWAGVGGRDEAPELAGSSHFLEHLLFKGTERRTAAGIAMELDEVGGEMNAYTASEHTAYYARVPAGELDVALDVLLDVVAAPALRRDEFEAEREVILEELAAAADDPEDVVAVRLFEALFPGHSLGREVLGSEASIGGLTRDDVAGFFSQWYRPSNLVVTAAGDVDHDLLAERVANVLDVGASGSAPIRRAPGPATDEVVVAHDPGELVHLAYGWRTPGAEDPDRFALAVLNHVLGATPSSRLFQRVREERGLTYSISSGLSQYSDAGALTVACATGPSKAATVMEIVDAELSALAVHGVSEAELARSQRSIRGSLLLGLETAGARSMRLGRAETLRGRVVPLDEHLAGIEAVTVADVARVAHEVLGSARVTSLVGPGDLDSLVARAE